MVIIIMFFFFYLHIFSAAGEVSPQMISFNNRPKRKTDLCLMKNKKKKPSEGNQLCKG